MLVVRYLGSRAYHHDITIWSSSGHHLASTGLQNGFAFPRGTVNDDDTELPNVVRRLVAGWQWKMIADQHPCSRGPL